MKKLGFGLLRLPKKADGKTIDLEASIPLIDLAMAHGVNYFDTAYIYNEGTNELIFREAVAKRYPRDAYTITDKMPMMNIESEDQLEPIFQDSLKKCGVDFFDYYWLHAIGGPNYIRAKKSNAFEHLKGVKERGLAKHIGMSYHGTPELLDQVLTEHPEVEFVQIQLNYLDWLDKMVQAKACHDVIVKHGKPIIVMEPVKGGTLAEVPPEVEAKMRAMDPKMSPASWAIRFAASQENVVCVLSGMTTLAQVEDNLSYMDDFVPLTEEEQKVLLECGDIIRSNVKVPCTGCRYCVDDCPMNICIPDYFAVYNTMMRFNSRNRADVTNYYKNLVQMYGRPTDCVRCGMCESRCPQGLTIRDYLEEAGAFLDKF
ncbi:MAG: aldo/keto reductase [Lachnospiraceae bacterium]|nr:aldo/keto reductase [Lachnospiraceae bacterium]